jgi:membrane-bound lytic murein transglycosylase D
MLRSAIVLVATGALFLASPAAAEDAFPRPAGLEDNVRFWIRIYTEVESSGGLIHDSRDLSVVYETVQFPSGLSWKNRKRKTEKIKKQYAATLRLLAKGRRSGLSAEQARVLAKWPPGVTNETLREAAKNVRFQLGQADRFEAGLARAGAWRNHIETVLSAHGVPLELSALPHVESSFTPTAYSRVGAAGLWQFTRSTGRLFMRVDNVVDERFDVILASVAAAKLLRNNYEKLGTWPLAINAYNHGPAGMALAVRKVGTTDIATISKRYKGRTFGFASRNFYSEFLAALEIDRNAERYFGPIRPDPTWTYDSVVLDHFYTPAALERAFGVDNQTLRKFNPSLRPSVWSGSKYVPKGFALALPPKTLKLSASEILASIPARERKAEQHRDRFYKVRRGDTLSRIAQRYGVRERELVAVNNLRSRHRIRAGQVLVLPDHASGGRTSVARSDPPADGAYRVRRGDNLSIIAQRFGVSESALAAENNLRNRNRIAIGQELRIPTGPPVVVATAPTRAPKAAAAAVPATAAKAMEPTEEAVPVQAAVPAEPTPGATPAPAVPAGSNGTEAAPDPSDYAVDAKNRITVQAAETLGHYADWLEISTSHLRRLNGIRSGSSVSIGRKVKMDFSRVTPDVFERRRLAYHHELQEEYFSAFEVVGTRTHTLRSGDTLWLLAERKYQVPVWLIRQYNPDLDFSTLRIGTRMIIPEVGERSS